MRFCCRRDCTNEIPDDRPNPYCKTCAAERARRSRELDPERYRSYAREHKVRVNALPPRPGRICTRAGCTNVLPDDRRDTCCKGCRAAYSREWREKNREKSLEMYRRHHRKAKANPKPETPEEAERRKAKMREYSRRRRERSPDDIAAALARHRDRIGREELKRRRHQRYEANKAREVANMLRWRKEHPEFSEYLSAYSKAYRQRNKEYFRAKSAEYRESNRADYNASRRSYWAKNRDRQVTIAMKAKAKRRGAPGHHTNEEWLAVLEAHGGRCHYCGVLLTRYTRTRDHVIALANGGSNDISNIVPACKSCNFKKRTLTGDEFKARMRAHGH